MLGGLPITLGLFFRLAVLVLARVMIVATTDHWAMGQGTPAHSFKNAWLFAGLLFIGLGRYSVDHLLAQRFSRGESFASTAVVGPAEGQHEARALARGTKGCSQSQRFLIKSETKLLACRV